MKDRFDFKPNAEFIRKKKNRLILLLIIPVDKKGGINIYDFT